MVKEKLKLVIKNVDLIVLVLILILSVLNMRIDNYKEPFLISINVAMLIYFAVRIIIKEPVKIIKSKLDVFVLIFVLATFIPLVCNTYISLYATVMNIMNYITLFWIYILTREIVQKSNKALTVIFNIIIIIAMFLIFIGIENLTSNVLFNYFDTKYINNGEDRLVSLFGNPNTLGAFITFAYFICTHLFINSKNEKSKIIYATESTILMTGIILTYSKGVFVVFPIVLITYMLLLKDKSKNIQIALNTIVSFIIGVVYSYLFIKLSVQSANLAILVLSVFWIAIAVLVNMLNIKLEKYIEKIKLKILFIGIVVFVILFTIWIALELHNGKPFVVFGENSTETYNAKIFKDIQPNQKYIFSFDMEANCGLKECPKDFFTINVIQRDKKNFEITNNSESFTSFSGVKDIEIDTTDNTSEIKIEFKVNSKNANNLWIINTLKINGKDVILDYKHLPTKLVNKLSDISVNYKTAQERFHFINDGIKVIQENFLTGFGGSGWKYTYKDVQEYDYNLNNQHCYIVEVWLEYGIVAIIALAGIIVFAFSSKNKNIGIKMALLALLLHSIIDLDMNFIYMKLMLFVILGILAASQNEEQYKPNIFANIFLIVSCVAVVALCLNPKTYDKIIDLEDLSDARTQAYGNKEEYKKVSMLLVDAFEEAAKCERFELQVLSYKTSQVQCAIANDINATDILDKYCDILSNYKNKAKYDINRILEKTYCINSVIQSLQYSGNEKLHPYISKLAKIMIDGFEETERMLNTAIEEKYEPENTKGAHMMLLNSYEHALSLYKEDV